MQNYKVEKHADSLLPDGKQWKLIWSDEFDGDRLDETKWAVRTHMMGKRAKHFVEDAISFDGNSNILFHLVYRDGVYCTTQLQTGYNFMDGVGEEYDTLKSENQKEPSQYENYFTWPIGEIKQPKFMHRYGYYECRCKMQQKPGWWSAFWLQSPTIGASLDPCSAGVEVDIMEQFERNDIVQCNNHWNGYGSQHRSTGAHENKLKPTADGYHRFGLEWTKDAYRYYIDGELVQTFTEPVSQIEQFILLSTEAVGYRSSGWTAWDTLEKSKGDVWVVDYVRVFDAQEDE